MIIGNMYYGKRDIVAVYMGTELIYQKDSSTTAIRNVRFNAELDMQGNVVAIRVVPVSTETKLDLGIEATVSTRPSVPSTSETEFSVGIEPYTIHTIPAAPVALSEHHINLVIEADVYAYNKAEIVLNDGVDFKMESEPMVGVAAQASLFEDISIEIEAAPQAPVMAPMEYDEGIVEISVESSVDKPDAAYTTVEVEAVEFSEEGVVQAIGTRNVPAKPEIELGVEAVVTVLPVAMVAAELSIDLDNETDVHIPDVEWDMPVRTGTNLYIRQVASAVPTGTTLRLK